MTLRMLDSIYPANLPPGADAYLGYVDGNWPTFPELQRLFPRAHLLSTTVFGNDAQCADVESGDMTIAQIYAWFTRQQARGVFRPCVYHSASGMDQVYATMTANGFPRPSYRLLSAHYAGYEHICGPSSCGLVSVACDGTQWRDDAPGTGGSLIDESVLLDDFFGAAPPPPPPSGNWTEAMIANLPTLQAGATDGPGHRFVHRVQGLCNALGVFCAIDGSFGPQTETAVKLVQRQFSITEDGIVGRATWGCLVAGQPA